MKKENLETKEKMREKELAKRYALFIVSLFFSALGVAITKKGELGVSPISSVANVLSLKFTAFSLGNWLIIWNCILIAGQVLLLRTKFRFIQLLQLPLSILFGYFTDFGMHLVSFFTVDSYLERFAMIIMGPIVLGVGVALSVIANVVMNSGEAFVKAVSDTIHKEFGNVKIVFDISCVVIAVVLSLVCFQHTIVGTREGTLIAAFCTGFVVKFFCKKFTAPLNRVLQH